MNQEPQQREGLAATTPVALAYATHEPPGEVGAMAWAALGVAVAWFFVPFLSLAALPDAPAVLISLVTVVPLAAIALGLAARRRTRAAPSRRRRGVAAAAIVLGCAELALLGTGWLTPPLSRGRESANRVKCASNLREIGQAILMYAQDHGGRFPAGFEHLITEEDLSSNVFLCPSGISERAAGATTQEVVQSFLADPIHCSYVYAGANLTRATTTPAHVLAYEPLGNHVGNPQGIHVLHGDGTVRWYAAPQAKRLIDELTKP